MVCFFPFFVCYSYFKRGMGGGSLGLDREETSLEPLSFNTFE